MYRVFLIDDEAWALISLEKLIDWEALGFTVSGKAHSAREAWDRISEENPDVIITDIRMPGMSGLELLERLRKNGMDTQVILVSGFAEFRYAQEAVHHGAFEYLLKQISREQLEDCLKRLSQVLDAGRKNAGKEEGDLRRAIPGDPDSVRNPAVTEAAVHPAAQAFFRGYGWQMREGLLYFAAACRDVGMQDAQTREALNWEDCAVFPLGTLKGAAWFLCASTRKKDQLDPLMQKISAISASDREVFSTWGFSRPSDGSDTVSALLKEAETALNSACFAGRSRLLYHAREGRWPGFEELVKAVGYGRNGTVREALRSLREAVRRGDVLTDELFIICERIDYEYRKADSRRHLIPESWNGEDALIAHCSDEEQFFSRLISAFPEEETLLMQEVMRLIDEHLADGITLFAVGKTLGMSQSSLSQALKRKTGKTYSELVGEKRMAKVRELLTYTELTMTEIAAMTGFSDQFYLSKAFKKVHGISPNEYRKGHRGGT